MTVYAGAISTMPTITTVTGNELIPCVYTGVISNYTITPALLKTYLQSSTVTPISGGGTGAVTAILARAALGAAASGVNNDITSLTGMTTPLNVGQGGTGATTLAGIRTAISAAASGANSDITSITGLSTALAINQGGTASTTAAGARSALSAAASGPNSDITAITGLSTMLGVNQGGTGSATAAGALTNLGAAAQATTISAGTGLSGGGDLSTNRTVSLASAAANTIKGNNTGGAAVPTDLTVAQVLALLGVDVIPQGRLTLTSLTPVLTSTVSAATTVYYTPYGGNLAPIWNATNIVPTSFTELSQALSDTTKSPAAAVASKVYDMFLWNDAGTIRCTRGPTWDSGTGGSNTVRGTGTGGTALSLVNGVYFNAAAITNGPGAGLGTYVGTIATDGGGGTVSWTLGSSAGGGGAAFLNVWNAYNRVNVATTVTDSTGSWTYNTNTFRQADNSNSNRITFVSGLSEDYVSAAYMCRINIPLAVGGFASIGLGFNSSTTPDKYSTAVNPSANAMDVTATILDFSAPLLGSNFVQAMEAGQVGQTAGYVGGVQQGLSMQFRM